jgi:hypothetical protein
MESKLNPVFIIIGLFLFKVGIIDNLRFQNNNSGQKREAFVDPTKMGTRVGAR